MLGLEDVPEHSRLWGLGLRALWNFWWDQLYEKVRVGDNPEGCKPQLC